MNKIVIGFVVLIVAVVGVGAVVTKSSNDNEANSSTASADTSESPKQEVVDATDQQQVSIDIEDYAFTPSQLTIKKGTTVTWTNRDSVGHDVAPEDETEEFQTSDLLSKNESYSVTFNTVGTFNYICSPHPYMQASVTVVE